MLSQIFLTAAMLIGTCAFVAAALRGVQNGPWPALDPHDGDAAIAVAAFHGMHV
jgi:hypothetical protein